MNLSERQTTYLTIILALQMEPAYFEMPQEYADELYKRNSKLLSAILPVLKDGMVPEDVDRNPAVFKESAIAHMLAEMRDDSNFDRLPNQDLFELMDDWAIIEIAETHQFIAKAIIELLPMVGMIEVGVKTLRTDLDDMLKELTSEGYRPSGD